MSTVTEKETLKVVRCSGAPAERGRQQGEELRPLIELGVGNCWRRSAPGTASTRMPTSPNS